MCLLGLFYKKVNCYEKQVSDTISMYLLCVHSFEGSPLSRGEWSNAGCNRVEALSNSSYTVCECDHLTHFAILLSPVPLNFSDGVVVSLEAIGYVGVTISLVAMAITIATFVIFRYANSILHWNFKIELVLLFPGHCTTCGTTSTSTSASTSS